MDIKIQLNANSFCSCGELNMDIGIDIIEIERIKKACCRERFMVRFFTLREISSIRPGPNFYAHLAGKFAAKEAVAKALGTGFRFRWQEVEILNEESGKPICFLSGKALDMAKMMNIDKVLVSISHSKDYAVAFAIAQSFDK